MTSPAGVRVVAVLVLCAATAVLNFGPIRYDTSLSGLVGAGFTKGWRTSTSGVRRAPQDGTVASVSRVPDHRAGYLYRTMPRLTVADGIRVTLEARTAGVADGRQYWQRASVLVWSFDRTRHRLRHVPHEVLRLQGTTDWTPARVVIPYAPETAFVQIVVLNAARAGTLVVRNLTVDAVTETPAYRDLRHLLIALWVLCAAWALAPLFRRGPLPVARGTALALGGLLLIGVFTPQPALDEAVQGAGAAVTRLLVPPPEAATSSLSDARPGAGGERRTGTAAAPRREGAGQPSSRPRPAAPAPEAATGLGPAVVMALAGTERTGRDYGHLIGWAALAAALVFAFPAARPGFLFGMLLLLGIATEMVQSFYISRTAEPGDLARDALGTALGLAIACLWRGLRRRHALGHKEPP